MTEVEIVEPLGHEIIVHARAGSDPLVFSLGAHHLPAMGDKLEISIELDALHLFDAASEMRLVT